MAIKRILGTLFLIVFCMWFFIHTTFLQNTLLNWGIRYLHDTHNITVVVDGFEYELFTHFKAKSIEVILPEGEEIFAKDIVIDVCDTFLSVKNAVIKSVTIKSNELKNMRNDSPFETDIKEALSSAYGVTSFFDQFSIDQMLIESLPPFQCHYLKEDGQCNLTVKTENQGTAFFKFFKTDNIYHLLVDVNSEKDVPLWQKHFNIKKMQGELLFHPEKNNLSASIKSTVDNQVVTVDADVVLQDGGALFKKANIQYGSYGVSLSGCFSFKNAMYADLFLTLMPDIKESQTFDVSCTLQQNGNNFTATFNADKQTFKSPFLDVILGDKLQAHFEQKNEHWFLTMDVLKDNPIDICFKDEKYSVHIKQKGKQPFFEDSKIIYDAQKQTLKGTLDIIGENIVTFDQSFKGEKINGKIFINLKDMAPLSTPFDLATVGRIKGDLIFKDFSITGKTGFLNIDLHSKFFRSGYFKVALTTLKGKLLGNLDSDLTLESKDLTLGKYLFFLGKGFMAEHFLVTLNGKQGLYKLQTKANAHKIGYLSSDVDVFINVDYDKNKQEITIHDFDFLHLKQRLKLQKPVSIGLSPLKTTDILFTINDKNMNLQNFSYDKEWRGTLTIDTVPLNILSWFFYKTMIVGTLSGSASLSGNDTLPDFDIALKGNGIQWGQFKASDDSNEELINVDLSIQKKNQRLQYDTFIKSKKLVDLKFNGHFNMQTRQCIDNALKGHIDMSLISALFATGDRLCGPLLFDLTLKGTFDQPKWQGRIIANKAYVELSEFGTVISNIQGNILASDNKWTVQSLNAVDTPLDGEKDNPGTVVINGTILFKDLFTPIVDLKAAVKNYQVVDMDAIVGNANGTLTIKGDGIFSTIQGDVDVQNLTVDLDRFHTEDGIPEIKLKDPKKRSFAKDYQKEHFTIAGKPIFPLDLTIKTNNRFFMHGAIVSESIWGGAIKVLGPIDKAYLEGSLFVQKGLIDFFGKILKIDKGKVTFHAYERNEPQLHIEASRKAADISVILKIDTQQDPIIQFDSSPSMSTDEILSWLLFGKSAGSVSAGQSIQLAAALAKLRGQKGFSLMDDFRKNIGLDTLEFREQENKSSSSFDTTSNQVIHIGKKVTDTVEMNVEQGANQGTSKVSVNVDVGHNITVGTGVSRESDPNQPNNNKNNVSVGLSWNKRY